MRTRVLVSLFVSAVVWSAALASPPGDRALAIPADSADLQWGPCPEFFPKGCEIAVLRGDPSKPNTDVFFRVPGNVDIPHHWHTSAEHMVLVSGRLDVRYDGQPEATLTPGMYAYGPPKLGHDARCASAEPCVLFIAFEQPVDAFVSPAKS